MDIKRKDAARLIDEILVLASTKAGLASSGEWVRDITKIVEKYGLKMPEPCPGQAHTPDGAFIDNCGCCMNYHWGLRGTDTKVK